jgi:hypothetical protein
MKVTKDLKIYLDEIDRLSKKAPKEKRLELENILKVILTLLVSLKESSNLGKIKFMWESKF